MREEILNEIRVRHTHKSVTQEEVNKNKYVKSLSLIGKFEAQLKIKKFDSLTYDISLARWLKTIPIEFDYQRFLWIVLLDSYFLCVLHPFSSYLNEYLWIIDSYAMKPHCIFL